MIKILNAQSIAPIEIHSKLYQVYGPNVMSTVEMYAQGTVRFTQHLTIERSMVIVSRDDNSDTLRYNHARQMSFLTSVCVPCTNI